jgi:hypothetical protein
VCLNKDSSIHHPAHSPHINRKFVATIIPSLNLNMTLLQQGKQNLNLAKLTTHKQRTANVDGVYNASPTSDKIPKFLNANEQYKG